MCGIVGLFIGCPIEDLCVKRAIKADFPSRGKIDCTDVEYKSKLANWDDCASVRSRPRRILTDDEAQDKLYFSPEFVPITKHEAIVELGGERKQKILTQHLYRYLDFTEKLEHIVVNRVAMAIALGYIGIELPEEMVFDAYKIYCDEAYHALFSADLRRQVQEKSGIKPRLLEHPYFLKRLREIQVSLPEKELQELVEIFFVIVSETLISTTLAQVPNDPRVATVVREVVNDHAVDEGRHHAYFASLLEILWPRLTPKQKDVIGPLLPELVFSFLSPDFASLKYEMEGYGLKQNMIERVLEETYPRELIVEATKQASKATLRYFEQNGVFEEPRTRDAFLASGLI